MIIVKDNMFPVYNELGFIVNDVNWGIQNEVKHTCSATVHFNIQLKSVVNVERFLTILENKIQEIIGQKKVRIEFT